MNQVYLKEHICDELESAKEYIQRAIEIKAMHEMYSR